MSNSTFSVASSHDETINVDPRRRRHARRWVSFGVGLSLALVLVALILIGMTSSSRAAPLAIRRPDLVVVGDPPGGSSRFSRELFAHPDVSATFHITLTNRSGTGEQTATDGYIQATVSPSTTLFSSPDTYVSSVVGDDIIITWTVAPPNIPIGASAAVTLYAWLPSSDNLLGTELDFVFYGLLAAADASSDDDTANQYYMVGPFIEPVIETSVSVAGNGPITQVVAGELVTATVVFTVPKHTVAYTATPRILLQDGLKPASASGTTAWVATTTDLDWDDAVGQGYMLEFTPFSATNEISDVVNTYTVTAVAQRNYPIQGGLIPHNTDLVIQSLLRWCETPGCVLDERGDYVWHTDDNFLVYFRRPQVLPTFETTYLDSLGQGEGGGQVRLTITHTNQPDSAIAYDMVLTATLGPGLTYDTASPTPDGSQTAGGLTILNWTLPVSLTSAESWTTHITATLPASVTAGEQFTVSTQMHQESFSGTQSFEGVYVETGITSLYPGLSTAQMSKNGSLLDMTIGERLTYTLAFTISPNATLATPHISDTLAAGFHYVSGTLSVQGATPSNVITQTGANGTEVLIWDMGGVVTGGTAQVVIATYQVVLDGIGTDGIPSFVGTRMRDFFTNTTPKYGRNSARLYYVADATEQYLDVGSYDVIVNQPNIGDLELDNESGSAAFIAGANSQSFAINFSADAGNSDAYDVQICQELPPGVSFQSDVGYTQGGCGSSYTPPNAGDGEAICWTIDQVCQSESVNTLDFQLQFGNGVIAGIYDPRAYVVEYSSLPGDVAGERYYSEFDDDDNPNFADVLMSVLCSESGVNCPFEIIGLGMSKVSDPDRVNPDGVLIYTIAYSNTTGATNYTNLVITDTYDPLLTLLDAPGATHDANNRILVWDVGTVSPGTYQEINFTVQVTTVVQGIFKLTDLLEWKADQTSLISLTLETPVDVATLGVGLTSPVTQTYAADVIQYTVTYSNTGSASKPFTITFDYDPYLIYGGIVGGDGTAVEQSSTTFVDADVPSGVSRALEISLTVGAPLPHSWEEIVSQVTLESAGAVPDTVQLSLDLLRPRFDNLGKTTNAVVGRPGSTVAYSIKLRNTGDLTATNCLITDTWDTNLAFDTSGGNAARWVTATTQSAIPDTFSLPGGTFDLAPGQAVTSTVTPGYVWIPQLTLQVVSSAERYQNRVDVVCDQVDQVPTTPHQLWAPSLATSKQASDFIAFPGRLVTFTIDYQNTDVVNPFASAVITDNLPAQINLESYTTSGMSGCSGNDFGHGTQPGAGGGTDVYWTCANLQAGVAGTLQVVGRVTSDTAFEGTVVTNTTESDANNAPYRPGSVDVGLPIIRPRLFIAKTPVFTHAVATGDIITYTLVYSNYGTATAEQVKVTDSLDPDVEYVSCSATDPLVTCAEQPAGSGTVEWELGDLAPQQQGNLSLVVQVVGAYSETVTNDNLTIESSRVKSTDPDNETVVITPTRILILDPHLTLSKETDPVVVTGALAPITYTLTFTNDGGGQLTNVLITDELSLLTTFVSAGTSAECSHDAASAGGVVTCTIGTLETDESGMVEIHAVSGGAVDEGDEILNQAQAASDQTVPTSDDATTWVFSDGCLPVLSADFTSDSPVALGQSLHFAATYEPSQAFAPITYNWTFDGAGTGSGTDGPTPVFTYTAAGAYSVTLEVDNACSASAAQAIHSVVVTSSAVPDIAVSPISFDVSMLPDATTQRTLRISNAGGAVLSLSGLAESPAAPWLDSDFAAGDVAVGGAVTVTLTFNSTGLLSDTYTTTLQISSNDPVDGQVDVPVSLSVTEGVNYVFLPLVLKDE